MKGRLLDVTECAACRGHHTRVLFVPLANHPGKYAAACPATGHDDLLEGHRHDGAPAESGGAMIRARKLGGQNNLTALYAHMTEPGRLNAWQDSWELAQYIRTTCLHTMIAEIRAQVPATRRLFQAIAPRTISEGAAS